VAGRREQRARRLTRRVAAAETGQRLVEALQGWLASELGEPVPMARVRALVSAGGVRVNGDVARAPGRPLRRGEHVQALVEPERLQARARVLDRRFTLSAEHVLFDDGIVLAVDKPPGLPTHATADLSRPSLVGHVESYLRARGTPVTPAVHQRLDRDTSGVVLFGIDARANAGLAKAFSERRAEKTYLAITAAPKRSPPGRFRIEAAVGAAARGREGVRIGGKGAQAAATDVLVREVLKGALLVAVRPLTGRRHQVRAHLAHAGLPILGDPVYGLPLSDRPAASRAAARPSVPRLMLHAWRLALPHPITGKPLVIESPIPADFADVLAALRSVAGG
jgi:23S rRNA pseudouridine1911/1915/1917 synthase